MKEIIAYEMSYKGELKYREDVRCVPFQKKYWDEYRTIFK